MFCSNCGNQIVDGSRFCNYCGSTQPAMDNARAISVPQMPLYAPMPSPAPAPIIRPVGEEQKKLSIKMRQAAVTLDNLLPIEKQIEEEAKYIENVKNKKIGCTFIRGYFPFIIAAVVSFLVLFIIGVNDISIWPEIVSGILVLLSFNLPIAIALIGIPIANKSQASRLRALEASIPAKEEALKFKISRRNELLTDDFLNTIELIPRNYRYSFAMNTIAGYFENGRAESMKEALNLFEVEKHQWRMEEIQIQQANMVTNQLDSIRKSSAITAGASVANAIYNFSR